MWSDKSTCCSLVRLSVRLLLNSSLLVRYLVGPPGSGKTTLARIIANEVEAEFTELSAVTSGKADVTQVIEHAKGNKRLGMQTILFVDEIHRFNKAQQDAFLPHVENGTIVLIGATTENPNIFLRLLHRCFRAVACWYLSP